MYLYEIIYSYNGSKTWAAVRATSPSGAINKLQDTLDGDLIDVLDVSEVSVSGADEVIE